MRLIPAMNWLLAAGPDPGKKSPLVCGHDCKQLSARAEIPILGALILQGDHDLCFQWGFQQIWCLSDSVPVGTAGWRSTPGSLCPGASDPSLSEQHRGRDGELQTPWKVFPPNKANLECARWDCWGCAGPGLDEPVGASSSAHSLTL